MRTCAIVLAAGEGTRMKVATAKVLLPVLGKPMVQWVLSAARGAGVEDCCLIVGKDWQQVEQCVGGWGARTASRGSRAWAAWRSPPCRGRARGRGMPGGRRMICGAVMREGTA